jgi:hypothetical protein
LTITPPPGAVRQTPGIEALRQTRGVERIAQHPRLPPGGREVPGREVIHPPHDVRRRPDRRFVGTRPAENLERLQEQRDALPVGGEVDPHLQIEAAERGVIEVHEQVRRAEEQALKALDLDQQLVDLRHLPRMERAARRRARCACGGTVAGRFVPAGRSATFLPGRTAWR